MEQINDNAYKLDLPEEHNVSATFNISYLISFDAGKDLKTNLLEEDENDDIEDKTITSTWDKACSCSSSHRTRHKSSCKEIQKST